MEREREKRLLEHGTWEWHRDCSFLLKNTSVQQDKGVGKSVFTILERNSVGRLRLQSEVHPLPPLPSKP